jgi:seryl-tRNA synthetase
VRRFGVRSKLLPSSARRYGATVASDSSPENRLSADKEAFDPNLVESKPEIIKSHLLARNVERGSELFRYLSEIDVKCEQRRVIRQQKHESAEARRRISDEIHQLIKHKRPQDAAAISALKSEVASASDNYSAADKGLDALYEEIDGLMAPFPNLLDDM